MDWFFDGLGTLLIGLVIGGAGGGAIGWRIGVSKVRQSQKAKGSAIQKQVGGNETTLGG